jgi:F-type H+-transporting ATPase subunit delta
MRPDAIARRYARALFGLADSQGSLEQVGSALAKTSDAIAEPEVMRVLTGPLSRERKRELLLKIIEAVAAPAVVRDFFLLLAERDRLRHAPAMRAVFERLLDARQGITRATIRSAAPVSPDVLEDVVRVFSGITGKRVVAEVQVVPELIAGIIVDVEGRVYDGSLRTQLGKLHQQMATGS